MRCIIQTAAVSLSLLIVPGTIFAQGQGRGKVVIDTPHNLSASGPDVVRASSEEQVCIFCHATHISQPIMPRWNRHFSDSSYIPYSSSALDANPDQPTGASKMCLSCHDGTIALGNVVSRGQVIQMARGITRMPFGTSNLGTDLSDDHPVSFRYDSDLAAQDVHLVNPASLPPGIKLDANLELQCTTCHDVHDNTHGFFLTRNNDNSELCISCHQIVATTVTTHENCTSCHQSHSAPSGPFLLQRSTIMETCLRCHDGTMPGALNVASDMQKFSVHDTNSPVDPVDPIPDTTSCTSCHDPHTMDTGTATTPTIHPQFGQISGVSSFGSPISVASAQYEVCFTCHGDQNAVTTSFVTRQIVQTNTRLEFELSAISFHPVQGPGRNPDVPSLKPPWNESSLVYCSDCHGSEDGVKAGGSGPDGVHGSNNPPLLLARYETADFTPESSNAYSLCYRCHYRDTNDGILRDRSFKEHDKHIVGEDAPCSVCHDAHGISSAQGSGMNNSHLINFDTSIVFTDPVTGRLEFQDLGTFGGRCFLSCHGKDHSPKEY